jgi:hypothetical protein
MEYARFGDKILQREDASQEWVETAADDIDARVAIGIAESLKEGYKRQPPKLSMRRLS